MSPCIDDCSVDTSLRHSHALKLPARRGICGCHGMEAPGCLGLSYWNPLWRCCFTGNTASSATTAFTAALAGLVLTGARWGNHSGRRVPRECERVQRYLEGGGTWG